MSDRYRLDLHTHTSYSWDGWMPPADLVRRARAAGLDRIAITDHHVIDGALRARDLDPDLVIVGEEIRCGDGCELIGLFLEQHVPRGLPPRETAARIHEQGGLVYAPHPFAYLTHPNERARELLRIADIIEVFNGRAFWPRWNARALRAVQRHALAGAASSDAHLPGDVGRAWTETARFSTPGELVGALRDARYVTRGTAGPLAHMLTLARGVARRARRGSGAARMRPLQRDAPAP